MARRLTRQMKTFKDNMDEQFTLELSLPEIRRIRGVIGLDVFNPQHHMQILNSLTDRLTFVWLLCEEQAKRLELNCDQFEERMQGLRQGIAVSDEVSNAFLEELADFFHRLGQLAMAKLTQSQLDIFKSVQERNKKMIEAGQFDSILASEKEAILSQLPDSDGNG